tara:strand:+ start:1574 stop:3277 length:1704 start_codon:yes stop_codon:yes gene_type:complete
MQQNSIDLTPAQIKEVKALLEQYLPDTRVWAYGSRVRWTSRPDSDLDLVAFASKEQQANISLLRDAFDESNLPFSVDLFVWDNVPEQFHKNIQQQFFEIQKAVNVESDKNSKWSTGRLGDYVDACLGKMLDKDKNRGEYSPYLGNKNVRWGEFELDDLAEMRFEEHEHERYGLQYGDLIICEGGEPGRCAIWTEEVPNMKIQKALHRVRPRSGLNNYYLHYWFTWAGQNGLLDAYFTGTTIKHLTGKALAALEIPIPPLDKQEAMVRVLKSLDDKITLNRQINTTLESMAQALFKSWFVDFDPVIDNARAAGNEIPDELQARADRRSALLSANTETAAARLPQDVQQLFPSRFVLTEEMGWVPEGWEVKPVSDALCINPKVSIKKGSVATYVDMKALPTSGFMIDESIDKAFSGGAKFQNRDVLLARITPCLENGKTGLVDFLADDEAGFGSTEFIVLREKGAITMPFVAALSRHPEFRSHCVLNMVGSSGRQRVQNACFDSYFVSTPAETQILKLFDKVCSPYFEKMARCRDEARSLSNLRNSLLPKLLSGQLSIPEAEQALDKVN